VFGIPLRCDGYPVAVRLTARQKAKRLPAHDAGSLGVQPPDRALMHAGCCVRHGVPRNNMCVMPNREAV